jgi:hypothetical protein
MAADSHGEAPAAPWGNDPAVVSAISASRAQVAAILASDYEAFAASIAPDCVVHAPLNRINDRAATLGAFRAGALTDSAFERRLEYAGRLGALIVTMGEEVIAPEGKALHAGRIVHRRFTDIWRNDQGTWRLVLRQATIIKVE